VKGREVTTEHIEEIVGTRDKAQNVVQISRSKKGIVECQARKSHKERSQSFASISSQYKSGKDESIKDVFEIGILGRTNRACNL